MEETGRAHLGSTTPVVASSSLSSSSSLSHSTVSSRPVILRCLSIYKKREPDGCTSYLHNTSTKSRSIGNLRQPRLSWFQILCRWFPLFLIFTTTTPLSLGMYKGAGPGSPLNVLETTLGSSGSISISQKSTDNIVNISRGEDYLNHSSIDNAKGDDDNKMTIPGLSEEDQKFLDRIQSSLRTVQNWDASTELFQECRSQVPWKILNNATGLYSNPEQDRLLKGNANALFLQRLCRWFPKFMSWVNSPPCKVCGYTECEMKTVRGPETEEEKEGHARRVEGEDFIHLLPIGLSL